MASQPVTEAAARESRANVREDMAFITSGAREKVDRAMANAKCIGKSLLHPLDKEKRKDLQSDAEREKEAAIEKRDEIRAIATQQAHEERAAARSMVAKEVFEAGGSRYPVLITKEVQKQPQPHLPGTGPCPSPPNRPPYENWHDVPLAQSPHATAGEDHAEGVQRDQRHSEGPLRPASATDRFRGIHAVDDSDMSEASTRVVQCSAPQNTNIQSVDAGKEAHYANRH
ncbi:hypothetical protein KP509_36G057500 [Ceratopteris richardii]|uniref:Uncharacterized protein n=1 Tax=Ceratopteris richardii TaxID=49495 RepID=A0A8T2QDA0_CERRI|nr:hypothetical protein KP509_36G057500 [Ceratopteris richardii]